MVVGPSRDEVVAVEARIAGELARLATPEAIAYAAPMPYVEVVPVPVELWRRSS